MAINSRIIGLAAVLFIAASSAQVFAQEPAPKDGAPKMEGRGHGDKMGGRRGGMRGGKMGPGRMGRGGMGPGKMGPGRRGPGGPGGILREFRGLNLTEGQRQQVRGILESNRPSEAVRQEMRSIAEARRSGTITEAQKTRAKELAQQGRTNMQAVRQQALAVLTPEQKQQLDDRMNKMKERREKMQQRREECKKNPGACQGPPPRPRG